MNSSRLFFVPRNRPGALAALIGLIATTKHIRMIHVYQSPAGIARDIARLRPAVVVATSEDICGEFLSTLREQGIAAIALTDMDAGAVAGCERSSALCAYTAMLKVDRGALRRLFETADETRSH